MKRSSKTPPPSSARLFSESHAAAPPAGVHIANIDGASRGNPGPASYAVVIRDPGGKVILELAKNIGRETNNVAEYYALLAALDYVTSHNIPALRAGQCGSRSSRRAEIWRLGRSNNSRIARKSAFSSSFSADDARV
jgi:hypothetical protein